MTKKAAKKKQVGKKASKKKTTAKKAGKEVTASVDEKSPKEEKGKEAAAEDSRKEAPASLPVRSSRVVRPDEKERGGGPSRSRPSRRGGRREGGSRVKVDEEELGTKAWKVFQQEIAEEGSNVLTLRRVDELQALTNFDVEKVDDLGDRIEFQICGVASGVTKKLSRRDNRMWALFNVGTKQGSVALNCYADAFEETYADDNWQRLEPYFTADAVYENVGMGANEGQEAIRAFLDGFFGLHPAARALALAPRTQSQ